MSEDIETEFGIVLGIIPTGSDCLKHVPLPGRKWEMFEHQCGGVSCNHQRIFGTKLNPHPAKIAGIKALCDRWYGTEEWGNSRLTLASANLYQESLREFIGANCNHSFRTFAEAWYPVDEDFAAQLTDEPLPIDFDDLIDWTKSPDKIFGCLNRWSLVILGENSD